MILFEIGVVMCFYYRPNYFIKIKNLFPSSVVLNRKTVTEIYYGKNLTKSEQKTDKIGCDKVCDNSKIGEILIKYFACSVLLSIACCLMYHAL